MFFLVDYEIVKIPIITCETEEFENRIVEGKRQVSRKHQKHVKRLTSK